MGGFWYPQPAIIRTQEESCDRAGVANIIPSFVWSRLSSSAAIGMHLVEPQSQAVET